MKKIIIFSALTFGTMFLLSAQNTNTQVAPGAKANTANANVERMRVVNQKMAAERAAAREVNARRGVNREEIAARKAANTAKQSTSVTNGTK
jgi:hypothetical protein